MSKERAKKIKMLLLDVDGVMTDGKIFLLPGAGQGSPQQREREEHVDAGGYAIGGMHVVEGKGFHAHDGTAFSLAKLAGLKIGLVTKRISETVALRARDLKVEYLYQGQANKREAFEQILAKEGFNADEVAFVGDDIVDLPVMRRCGLAIAVPNAREEVKDEAHVVTDHAGGEGAVRDAVEYILRAQDKLGAVVEQYIHDRSPIKK